MDDPVGNTLVFRDNNSQNDSHNETHSTSKSSITAYRRFNKSCSSQLYSNCGIYTISKEYSRSIQSFVSR